MPFIFLPVMNMLVKDVAKKGYHFVRLMLINVNGHFQWMNDVQESLEISEEMTADSVFLLGNECESYYLISAELSIY